MPFPERVQLTAALPTAAKPRLVTGVLQLFTIAFLQ